VLPKYRFRKRVGTEPARSFPRFNAQALIRDEVAATHHFIPFQTPEAFRNTGWRG
jgi:hypothetical protein